MGNSAKPQTSSKPQRHSDSKGKGRGKVNTQVQQVQALENVRQDEDLLSNVVNNEEEQPIVNNEEKDPNKPQVEEEEEETKDDDYVVVDPVKLEDEVKSIDEENLVLMNFADLAKGDSCSLCLMDFESHEVIVRLRECEGHYFHNNCGLAMTISEYIQQFNRCPYCKHIYGIVTGIQPNGTFRVSQSSMILEGEDDSTGTYTLEFNFPNGIQSAEHPHPNVEYQGTSRTGYLPINEKGTKVLELMQVAWERRLMFTIGQSITTGVDNCVIWNGIHVKTSTSGGFSSFGYPDATYLDRVLDELANKGVK